MTVLNSFLLFMIIPFTAPVVLIEYYSFGGIINIWKILSIAVFIVFLVVNKTKITGQTLILLSLALCCLISTIRNPDATILTWMSQTLFFWFLALLLDTMVYAIDYYTTVKMLFWILAFETGVNFVSQIMFPNGIYYAGAWNRTKCFILGMENRFVFTYITCLALGLTLKHIDSKYNLYFYIVLAISILSLLLAWSVGAMLGLFLFLLIILNTDKLKHIINEFNTTLIWLIGNAAIVVYRVQSRFSSTFASILKKDIMTFAGRTPIWDVALYEIRRKPIFGYGLLTSDKLARYFLGLSHPHNEILHVLFQSGIVGFFVFLLFMVICLKNASKYRGTEMYCEFIGLYFSLMIMLLVDSWTSTAYFYMIFILISNMGLVNEIVENYGNLEKSCAIV